MYPGSTTVDPVARKVGDIVTVIVMESASASEQVTTETKRDAIISEVDVEVDEAVRICENEKYVEPEEAYNDVYSSAFPVRHDALMEDEEEEE